jgi:hypothetical protein
MFGIARADDRLSLWRQGPRVRHTARDPARELTLRPHPLVVDAQPTVQGPAAHLEATNVRPRDEPVRLRGLHANQEVALAAGAHRHVPTDEERETTEHPLLREAGLLRHELADAVGELRIEGHTSQRTYPRAVTGDV